MICLCVYDWTQGFLVTVVVLFGGMLCFLFLHKVKHNVIYVVCASVSDWEREVLVQCASVLRGFANCGLGLGWLYADLASGRWEYMSIDNDVTR